MRVTCAALTGGSAGTEELASRPKSSEAAAAAAKRTEAGADDGRADRFVLAAGFAEEGFEEDGRCSIAERLALRDRSAESC
jgi:hypothetical protein